MRRRTKGHDDSGPAPKGGESGSQGGTGSKTSGETGAIRMRVAAGLIS